MIIVGMIDGQPGWMLTPVQWVAALVMICGIALVGNLNPLHLLKRRQNNETVILCHYEIYDDCR